MSDSTAASSAPSDTMEGALLRAAAAAAAYAAWYSEHVEQLLVSAVTSRDVESHRIPARAEATVFLRSVAAVHELAAAEDAHVSEHTDDRRTITRATVDGPLNVELQLVHVQLRSLS